MDKTYVILELSHYVLHAFCLALFAFFLPIGMGLVKHGRGWDKVWGFVAMVVSACGATGAAVSILIGGRL